MVWKLFAQINICRFKTTLGICDVVFNLNIAAKTVINLGERLNMVAGFYINLRCDKLNLKTG